MSPQHNPYDPHRPQGPEPVSLKDELARLGRELPGDDDEAVRTRTAELCSSLKPYNTFEMWLTEQVAVEELRSRRLQIQQVLYRQLQARRAALCWDEQRRLEAEELAVDLARRPAVVSRRLQQTRQGCDALLERWRALGRALENRGEWTAAQRSLALDLLGTPSELRDGPTALDPAPGGSALEVQQEVVRREVARLERLQSERLNELDEAERALAAGGASPPDAVLTQLMRLEAACRRRLQWARGQFKAGRHAYEPWASTHQPPTRPQAPSPAPVPADAPMFPPVTSSVGFDTPAPTAPIGYHHRS